MTFKTFDKKPADPFRLVLAAPPDHGKTMCLAHLANMGKKLIIFDFDEEKTGPFSNVLEKPENVLFKSYYNEYKDDKSIVDKKNMAFETARLDLIELQRSGQLDDPNTFVVIDTVSNMAKSVMRWVERSADERKTYNTAWTTFLDVLSEFTFRTKKCNLIMLGHLFLFEGEKIKPAWGVDTISKNNSIQFRQLSGISCLHLIERNSKGELVVRTKSEYKKIVKSPYVDMKDEIPIGKYFQQLIEQHANQHSHSKV